MSFRRGPSVVVDSSLVLYLDAANLKSYPVYATLPVTSGNVAWYDANDSATIGINTGTYVNLWRDKSGNNINLTQNTSTAYQPTYATNALNGKPVLRFDGNLNKLVGSLTAGIVNCTMIMVMKTISNPTEDLPLSLGTAWSPSSIRCIYHYANVFRFAGWANDLASAFSSDAGGTYHTFSIKQSGTNITFYKDGTIGTGSVGALNTTSTDIAVGGIVGNDGYYNCNCDIAEVIVYDRALSSSEMSLINIYLSQKWGTTNIDNPLTWTDLSGKGNNGTLINGPTYNSSKKGSLVFDGTDDSIQILNTTIFSGSQTYETFFVKDGLGVVSVQGLLTNHKYDETANIGLNYMNDASTLSISIGYTDGTREYNNKLSNYVIPNNIITHACLTFNLPTNTVTLYVNGIYDSSWVLTKTVKFVSNYFYVGQWSNYGYYYFSGKIFNPKVYNRALTAAEVLQNYNATKNRFQ